MSVHLAKTQSGNSTTQGRRTPSLSLTQPAKNNAGNKSTGSAATNSVTVEKNDKHEKALLNNDTGSTEKSKSDLNEKHAHTAAATSTTVATSATIAASAAAAAAAVEAKKDEILQENGYTNGHKRNDNSKDDDKKSVSEAVPMRESQRNKEKKEQIESPKKVEKIGEKTRKKIEKDNSKGKILEETEKKKTATEKNNESVGTKKIDKKATHESAGKKDEKKSHEIITVEPVKKCDEKKQESPTEERRKLQDVTTTAAAPTKDVCRQSIAENQSLWAEQKDNEMEPLVFEAEGEIHGHPDASSTPGKVLKHRQGPLYSEEKLKEESKAPAVAASNPISTSHSFHRDSPAIISSMTSTIPRPGRISGRRSIRNLPDISFENRYAGSYRQIPDDDRWPSSMNVTVGSEIPNESSSTASSFSFFGRGKKRERTPPINQIMGSQDSELSPKSPKRARLDFGGFLGFVASPMTMLRAKFSRARIQSSSTPNSKENKNKKSAVEVEAGNDGNEDEEDVVNVSGIVADEDITAVETAGNDDEDVCIVDEDVEDLAEEIGKDAVATDEKLMGDDNVVGVKEQISTAASAESAVNKRKMCNVM